MSDKRCLKISKSKADDKLASKIRKCIKKDKFHKIQALIANIHPDSVLNKKGQTGLHLSCKYGHPDCLDIFLRQGASKDLQDKRGNIPLHFAAKFCMAHPYPAHVRDLVTNPFLDNLDLLEIQNKNGTSPKMLLKALNRAMDNEVTSSDSSLEEGDQNDSWEEKLRAANEDDLSDTTGRAGREEMDYKNCYNENYDQWANRIYSEFMRKRRPRPSTSTKVGSEETVGQDYKRTPIEKKHPSKKSASVETKVLCLKQLLKSEDMITLKRIPFTLDSTSEMIISVLMGSENEESKKRLLRDALRIWHPDKFLQKFQHRIQHDEKDEIVKLVNYISTVLLHY